jgi:hypothetical protein
MFVGDGSSVRQTVLVGGERPRKPPNHHFARKLLPSPKIFKISLRQMQKNISQGIIRRSPRSALRINQKSKHLLPFRLFGCVRPSLASLLI